MVGVGDVPGVSDPGRLVFGAVGGGELRVDDGSVSEAGPSCVITERRRSPCPCPYPCPFVGAWPLTSVGVGGMLEPCPPNPRRAVPVDDPDDW